MRLNLKLNETARNEAACRAAADHQQRNDCDGAEHVGGRVGESDLLTTDVAQGEDLVDLKLMDRIGHPRSSFIFAGFFAITG